MAGAMFDGFVRPQTPNRPQTPIVNRESLMSRAERGEAERRRAHEEIARLCAEVARLKAGMIDLEIENAGLRARLHERGAHSEGGGSVSAVSITDIVRIVCEISGGTEVAVLSSRRLITLVKARQLIAWLAREHTGSSLPLIGRRLGGRDHTTILHACRRVDHVVKMCGLALPDALHERAELLWATPWPSMPAKPR